MKLRRVKTIELKPTAPMAFDASFHKPDHYSTSDNAWEQGVRWQTMLFQNQCLGLKFENAGTVKRPKINLHVFSKKKLSNQYLDSLVAEIRYRYDLDSDLSEFTAKFKSDKQLGPVIKKWPGMRPMSPQSLYEYLVIGIMLQNCTVKRSVNMTQALFENYGTKLEYDNREFYCFWEPAVLEKVSEEELRALKVGYRAKSLKRVTMPFAKGEIDELDLRDKPKEEQREALISLYGIGPATVGYILFDVFKRYEELNYISPWEQKIYSKLFFDRDPNDPVSEKKLLNLFEKRFGEYKMLAVHYIWEDLWWTRLRQGSGGQAPQHKPVPWLEELIRL